MPRVSSPWRSPRRFRVAGRRGGGVGDLVVALQVLGLVLAGLDGGVDGSLDAALEPYRVGWAPTANTRRSRPTAGYPPSATRRARLRMRPGQSSKPPWRECSAASAWLIARPTIGP